jgi:hypothetical protein
MELAEVLKGQVHALPGLAQSIVIAIMVGVPPLATRLGTDVGLPRFTLADTAVNEILIRQILSIRLGADA